VGGGGGGGVPVSSPTSQLPEYASNRAQSTPKGVRFYFVFQSLGLQDQVNSLKLVCNFSLWRQICLPE
jgi:hypothetical protein